VDNSVIDTVGPVIVEYLDVLCKFKWPALRLKSLPLEPFVLDKVQNRTVLLDKPMGELSVSSQI
jgi:hypothetical protein